MSNGSMITDNTASKDGGGVYIIHPRSIFNLQNGRISDNTAETGGGVCNSGTFNNLGGKISGNTAVTGHDVYP
jgi:hypothetical protein